MARTAPYHPGEPRPQVLTRAAARLQALGASPGVPHVGDGVSTTIDLINAYAELTAVSLARARFLGALLAEQYEQAQEQGEPAAPWDHADDDAGTPPLGGAAGLIGHTYAASVVGHGDDAALDRAVTGEEVRGLVRLEAEERDRAARLIRDGVRLGIDLDKAEVMRGYAATTAAAMRALIVELGLDMDAEPVLRAAGRAALVARRVLGHDDGDPDAHIGPPLTGRERDRVLRAALERAPR